MPGFKRRKRKHKTKYRRQEKRSQQHSNNFLVVLLSLIVLFETILLLFLLPQRIPTKAIKDVSKKEVKVKARESRVKPSVKTPFFKIIKKKPPKKIRGEIAIVLDDWGYNKNNLSILKEIKFPLTIAILPFRYYSKDIAEFGHKHNFEILIHMPMEPEDKQNIGLEPKTLMVYMDDQIIKTILREAFDNIPYAKGVNNHMGSFATRDEKFITTVFRELKRNNLYFLDSLVISNSVCRDISRRVGIKFAERSIFLDNKSNVEYIRGQLMELVGEVDRKGRAIGIGHDRKNTLKVLKEVMPQLSKQGYKFVYVSEIVE
ncbi:MAG: divergent polysaccharide deacetylase family protein [Candidatus Omnitrophica bacterium]|nr:divergent polysaccharide deacetylase family protein [Candidatus Omnitrophota bacterium]